MSYLSHLEDSITGARFDAGKPQNNQGTDGALLVARYDLDRLGREVDRDAIGRGPATLWRYAPLLPADDPARAVTMGEGWTPMIPCPRLGAELGMPALHVKDEGLNPTGSFKDRGSSVAVTRYRELGVTTLMLNSSGNAGGSWALYCARAGLRFVGVLPTDNQPASRKQCIAAGADTYLLEDWHQGGKLVREATARHGWFNANTLLEPYRTEGKKTMGLEIAEQCSWQLPDVVIYPMGGGTGSIAIWKAFEELLALGWASGRAPRCIVTQYEGCAPIVKAWEEGTERVAPWGRIDIPPGGLKSPNPVGGRHMLELIRATGGAAVAVNAAEAIDASRALARSEGIFACPEGATTLAGLRRCLERGLVRRDERVVLMNTGSGLKSIPSLPDRELPVVTSAAEIAA